MAEHRAVTDEEILSGFASLHEAIAAGFASQSARMDSESRQMRAELGALEHRMLRRFDGIDQRFDVIEKRLDAMDQRFDAMDRRFDAMDRRFDRLEVRVVRLEVHAGTAQA